MLKQLTIKENSLVPTYYKPLSVCFCLLISMIFLWELECTSLEKVGLLAGLYSGTSRPDLNRTPQALHSVLGPSGPALHCGVFSAWQCWHFRPIGSLLSTLVVRLAFGWWWLNSHNWWSGTAWNPRRLLRLRLLRARTGTWRLPQQLIMVAEVEVVVVIVVVMLLLLVLFSSTEMGLWWWLWAVLRSPGRMSTNVSTAGNASLLDNHSSSSVNSCNDD